MDVKDAIRERHSVREYIDRPIEEEKLRKLREAIDGCNAESGLRMQLVADDPAAFDGFMAHYGKFKGVRNYIAVIGKRAPGLNELAGYYGERVVLEAQMLGLNTCWVAMTVSKGAVKSKCGIRKEEKLACVIALGYGANGGRPHKTKRIDEVCDPHGKLDWFLRGVESALLAPTAVNQQKFFIDLVDGRPTFKATGGFYSDIDLGVVKYHFEIGSSRDGSTAQ